MVDWVNQSEILHQLMEGYVCEEGGSDVSSQGVSLPFDYRVFSTPTHLVLRKESSLRCECQVSRVSPREVWPGWTSVDFLDPLSDLESDLKAAQRRSRLSLLGAFGFSISAVLGTLLWSPVWVSLGFLIAGLGALAFSQVFERRERAVRSDLREMQRSWRKALAQETSS